MIELGVFEKLRVLLSHERAASTRSARVEDGGCEGVFGYANSRCFMETYNLCLPNFMSSSKVLHSSVASPFNFFSSR